MNQTVFDVAIIGYGPAGATLANLLGQYGLSVLVLEREAEIYPLPRAIHFDGETMRVFETAGLRPQVETISRPGLKGMYFNNAAGETLLIRAGTQERGPHGCATNHYFHQPELEAVLRSGLQRYPHVQVRTRHEVTAIQDDTDVATLQVTDLQTQESHTVQARYVVGCDGARSMVRKVLGTRMRDLGLHQPWLVFDVRLKTDVPGLPDHTVQHCDPARPMTYCNVTGNRRRWEIMLMPGDDPAQLVQPETLWKLVRKWVTPSQADIERAVIYTFHSVIAEGWRQGRLMLAGDAAHQTPPFLGQGMCAAIRDASNLAWKLNAVLRGRADDALLDTYESERSPHVQAFIDLAVKLGDIIQTTDPQAALERDAKFKAGQPEIFQFPAPRLGPGVWQGEQAAVAQVFPQPTLADGRLLDAVLGLQFAVIGDETVLNATSDDTRAHWQAQGVVVLPARDPELQTWLTQQGVRAVLLRPDRYILGVAQTGAELDSISALLPAAAALTP
ncbi:bifunctional 3-(3-hydroxy-phenyl)propionate/3-hydroxycinnamic acid hydroxylase [Limnohabitans sp.]|uniref:bifunctional 3-(3-hydroxy-phenyl)propionate/3-hydroxycinnamic acid hydroxylase MhpA n=1 Tax=Limnohabitans sp. TaxID=1907725 RepID=UPI0026128168|nr:bifunctional 3-(3-hydroxy-phenyl)propionate/3-hydroxycinnamic acid hydroxylase [Limnohabitans sp.]